MTFNRSLALGGAAEEFVKKIFALAGISCLANTSSSRSNLVKYDLCCDGQWRFTVEVKFDVMEAKTGNVAVEYFNTKQGKPSGILATEANLWVYVLNNPLTAWACQTSALKRFFESAKPYREIASGGDDNAAMKLYRREEIFSKVPFHRIDNLHGEEIVGVLEKLLSET